MKKFILLFLFFSPFLLNAQGFFVETGINFPKLNYRWTDVDNAVFDGNTSLPKIRFGINYDFTLVDNIYLSTGLIYNPKGNFYKEHDNYSSFEYKYNLNYLEVPLQLKYVNKIDDFSLFGKFGPYLSYGISGNYSWIYNSIDDDWDSAHTSDDVFGNDKTKNKFKPLDIGLGLGAGVNYKGIELSLNYSFGLSNIALYTNEVAKNKVFSFGLGYRFNE